jgi:hypothetical protein
MRQKVFQKTNADDNKIVNKPNLTVQGDDPEMTMPSENQATKVNAPQKLVQKMGTNNR